jgi:glycosyltransferase involved in cell wall biosynthesis
MSNAFGLGERDVAHASRPLQVAIASIGDPASPDTWSGVAAGVFHALCDLGVEVQGLDLALPAGLEQAMLASAAISTRNRFDAHGAALTMKIRSLLVRRRWSDESLDGVIQIGTNFSLPDGVPYVTLEDMTLRQGVAVHPVFSRMSTRGVAGWERRRAGIYHRARRCAVASHWAADSLLGDYGLAPERVAVVGFGANHRADVPDREWRSPRLLFVGIDWERKGGPLVLRAFARLRRDIPDATLDVVGGHPLLQEPGVNAHGVLSQASERDRETMAELFARATCFVMPSLVEPFGIAYVEAASAGVPSIGSSLGGPRDVIGADGGVLVEPADEEGLVEAMLRLADPDTAQRMGAAAHARSALYTWPKVAERLLRALGLPAPDGRTPAEFL